MFNILANRNASLLLVCLLKWSQNQRFGHGQGVSSSTTSKKYKYDDCEFKT
jgi:hypothetical protein